MNLFAKPLWMVSLALLMVGFPQYAAAEEIKNEVKVESVEVQLSSAGKLYEGLQDRMEFSVGRVGDKILLAQPLSLLEQNYAAVKTAILNVFTKVLVGFKVEAVDLTLGVHTKVIIYVTPVPPLITTMRVQLETGITEPELRGVLDDVVARVETEINQIFNGLPVASLSWSDGIVDQVLNYLLEKEFPGFTANYTLVPGAATEIRLKLTPHDPVVNEVLVDYTTENIPDWFLRSKVAAYQEKVKILKGLPVEFLTHYQPRVEKNLIESFRGFPDLRTWGLQTDLRVVPGPTTRVFFKITSQKYQVGLEGRYFFGEDKSFGFFQTHVGYRTNGYELYTRCLFGENPGGHYRLGVAVPLEKSFTGGFEYELENHDKNLCFHFLFERGDYLDLRMGIAGTPNEAQIGIYLNKHASFEVADYGGNMGIQLMFRF